MKYCLIRQNHEKLTQEQLLEEAKETELLNLKSLEKYHQLELEKKKTRPVKKANTGPMIRYLSTTMPLIAELPSKEGEGINIEDIETKKDGETSPVPADNSEKKVCERTFITCSNDSVMDANFNRTKVTPPVKNFCPITRSVR